MCASFYILHNKKMASSHILYYDELCRINSCLLFILNNIDKKPSPMRTFSKSFICHVEGSNKFWKYFITVQQFIISFTPDDVKVNTVLYI